MPESAIHNPQSAILSARRHFLQQCRIGLGAMALGSLLADDGFADEGAVGNALRGVPSSGSDPLAPRPTHFTPRAKNVIFMFMAGGPSQLELFTPKPKLQELGGQVI